MNPHLQVACAIIEDNGTVLAAQRSSRTSLPLKWEFPGGKIEAGETAFDCLHRELSEELSITVSIRAALSPSTHCYEHFTVTLHPFVCTISGGTLTLHEHQSVVWIKQQDMATLDWAFADIPVIKEYLAHADSTAKRILHDHT
jgi:8-oxo-dGTP diphosphatase